MPEYGMGLPNVLGTPALTTLLIPPRRSRRCFVPVQLLFHQGRLYAFVGKMTGHDAIKQCVLYRRDDATGRWHPLGDVAKRFLPNFAPVKMADGNFIMAGRTSTRWPEKPLIPAVAVSPGGRLTEEWEVVPLVEEPFPNGQCAETTLIVDGPEMLAVVRNNNRNTLQHYATFNHPLEKAYRGTLVIAVSRPGEAAMGNVWMVQQTSHGHQGSRRPIMSHYPCAIESYGKLYVAYSARFGHTMSCELAVIPVSSLEPKEE